MPPNDANNQYEWSVAEFASVLICLVSPKIDIRRSDGSNLGTKACYILKRFIVVIPDLLGRCVLLVMSRMGIGHKLNSVPQRCGTTGSGINAEF